MAISADENVRLTQVGPGTPMGELLRRYWHIVAAAGELNEEPVLAVRLLGEDLTLYRDRSGKPGLVARQCADRGVSLAYGIPEATGLRCPYHGWLYGADGQCLDTPAEAANSAFKQNIKITAYPVEELGGLIWAYLGPQPVPLLPRYDVFAAPNAMRQVGIAELDCNWLQAMENGLDPVHVEYLHGHYQNYVMERLEREQVGDGFVRHHEDIAFDRYEYGMIKRRKLVGDTEESENWKYGHSIVFPNIIRSGPDYSPASDVRVPIDDTHMRTYLCFTYIPSFQIEEQSSIPAFKVPIKNPDGSYIVDYVVGQDFMAWASGGAITNRSNEHLAWSDKGIRDYRELVGEQLARIERGEDPIAVVRDPSKNQLIDLPHEKSGPIGTELGNALRFETYLRYSPIRDQYFELMARDGRTEGATIQEVASAAKEVEAASELVVS